MNVFDGKWGIQKTHAQMVFAETSLRKSIIFLGVGFRSGNQTTRRFHGLNMGTGAGLGGVVGGGCSHTRGNKSGEVSHALQR